MPVLQREEYRARARTLASYLVTGAGHGCAHGYDGVRSEGELEEHLQSFDEIALPGELARLHDRIDAACAEDFEWGQFEVWWENPAREHRLSSAQYVLGRMYRHDDVFLRALLRQARLQRSEEPLHPLVRGRSTVDLAWARLLYYFYQDRNIEQWRRGDWTPSDMRGPGRI